MYKRILIITLAAIGLSFLASSCVKEKGFEEKVQDIAQTKELSGRIATLNEQAAGMEKSITQLQSAKEKLEQYAAKLEQGLEAAKSDITSNKEEIASLQTELTSVKTSIITIKASIETIKNGLSDLSQHVNDTIGNTRTWVEQTFATLERTKEVDDSLAKEISANRAALDTVYTHCRKEISDSLSSAVKGIQTWVNKQLTGYWTIAKTRAKLDSVARAMEVKDSTALSDSLKKASADLTTAYKAAIETAITNLKGALNDTINHRIKKATDALEAKITNINTRLDALETTVGQLIARIQSVEVIPEYQDGSVEIKQSGTVTVSFEVRPASLLDSIVKKASAKPFSIQAVETKAVTKAVTYRALAVTGAKVDSASILTLTVAKGDLPDDFFTGAKHFNARLHISDGNTDKTSAFFPLYVKVYADLSKNGTSNCYIVSKAGDYKFKAVKGNSDESVGTVSAVSVLWESYGTSETITTGDLIKSDVSYDDGYITFTTGDEFSTKKGNAVIAARDASRKILWSWHIWLTDQPAEQVYNNSAGTMMDRNLGATSAEKGQVSALGLLYQWGRKDPFLGSSSISSSTQAASTLSWPLAKAASKCLEGGNTLAYSISYPTTYIKNENEPCDWYCTNQDYKNDTLWKTSEGKKTKYDPCPVGYRVPNGGASGVWCTAFDTTGSWTTAGNWDGKNKGMDFSTTDKKLVGTSGDHCWYPAAGYRLSDDGSLYNVGDSGYYWSCTPNGSSACSLFFDYDGGVTPSSAIYRAHGRSVRCLKE